MKGYFFAFINELISIDDFENWVYSSLENISKELQDDPELLTALLECDYSCENDIFHLKFLLENKFEYPENYIQFINENNAVLKELIEKNERSERKIIFDCTGIETVRGLHAKIRQVFKFSDWYGMNWYAFEDWLDLAETEVFTIIDFYNLQRKLPRDTAIFLDIVRSRMPPECKLTLL